MRNDMTQAQVPVDTSGMSDEEFLQLDPTQLVSVTQEEAGEPSDQEDVVSDVGVATESTTETTEAAEAPEVASADEATAQEALEESSEDYRAFYDAVTKPFNANGKETRVTSPDDIVRLMQQGAGFHKKMESMKPLTRIGKLLEDNELLDETQLSYLIDLHHKKPEAIAALIKESGIDLLDFDVNVGNGYVPQAPQVNESVYHVQSVLDDLQANSPTYVRTINILGTQWDAASREMISQHPELIRIIDSQVQDGTYDKINQAIEYERMFGRLQGVSDLQAYKQVGELMFSQPQPIAQADTAIQPQPNGQPTGKPVVTAQARAAKQAAAAPRTSNTNAKLSVDTSRMSDAEFLAHIAKQQALIKEVSHG